LVMTFPSIAGIFACRSRTELGDREYGVRITSSTRADVGPDSNLTPAGKMPGCFERLSLRRVLAWVSSFCLSMMFVKLMASTTQSIGTVSFDRYYRSQIDVDDAGEIEEQRALESI
jgi:hypothetical protein